MREYEIHPVKIVATLPDGTHCMEQCEPNDPLIFCWSVYEHLHDPNDITVGGLECLQDFANAEKALRFYRFIQTLPENERVLRDDEILERDDMVYQLATNYDAWKFQIIMSAGITFHRYMEKNPTDSLVAVTRKSYELLEVSPPCQSFMLTMYARKERTTDKDTLMLWPKTKSQDTVLSKTPGGESCGRIPWYVKQPRKNQKFIMHNCARYHLIWTNDKGELL